MVKKRGFRLPAPGFRLPEMVSTVEHARPRRQKLEAGGWKPVAPRRRRAS